jgi:GNAT superfamily N-acetyltransferase
VKLSPPRPLRPDDDVSSFSCGRPVLDNWLRDHARRGEADGAARIYVVDDGRRVVACYSLVTGSIALASTRGGRRDLPDPILVMVLDRLAVDHRVQGLGVGRALLRDAVARTLNAAEVAPIRALLVHALDERVAGFYRAHGFRESPSGPLLLMLPLDGVRRSQGGPDRGRER